MNDEHPNKARFRLIEQGLADAGLAQYLPAIKGTSHAIDLQHILRLKQSARAGREPLEVMLAESGIDDAAARGRIAGFLIDMLKATGGDTKPAAVPEAGGSEDWRAGVADASGGLPMDVLAHAETVAASETDAPANPGANGDWPPGMKIVNPHLAHNLREQGMLRPANTFGYIHLAGEVERPSPLRKPGPEKRELLEKLKSAAAALAAGDPEVRRADVFTAFIIPPGAKEGRRVAESEHHDLHVAEFDIVILVECENVEAARRVRAGGEFAALKALLDAEARFVHCVTAGNPKRIAEVDKTRDGIFLFNYFFAADIASKGSEGIDILLAVWEYTAGWWTAKANLTNSTPLQPLPGERSEYSLINHCRWDRPIDVLPHLIFRPSLGEFVLKNFTANEIMAMPVLYRLA